jgi:hypothetical protein
MQPGGLYDGNLALYRVSKKNAMEIQHAVVHRKLN